MKRLTAAITLFFLTFMTARPGWTFAVKTHVKTANIAVADLVDGAAYLPGVAGLHRYNQESAGKLGLALADGNFAALLESMCRLVEGSEFACRGAPTREVSIFFEDLRVAIFLYPQMVRGGVVGPDTFPDPIWGAQVAHVNHGRHEDGKPTKLRQFLGNSIEADVSDHALDAARVAFAAKLRERFVDVMGQSRARFADREHRQRRGVDGHFVDDLWAVCLHHVDDVNLGVRFLSRQRKPLMQRQLRSVGVVDADQNHVWLVHEP